MPPPPAQQITSNTILENRQARNGTDIATQPRKTHWRLSPVPPNERSKDFVPEQRDEICLLLISTSFRLRDHLLTSSRPQELEADRADLLDEHATVHICGAQFQDSNER